MFCICNADRALERDWCSLEWPTLCLHKTDGRECGHHHQEAQWLSRKPPSICRGLSANHSLAGYAKFPMLTSL